MRNLLKRLLCRHAYSFQYKAYKGNKEMGHVESEYGFFCHKCGKVHRVKVSVNFRERSEKD